MVRKNALLKVAIFTSPLTQNQIAASTGIHKSRLSRIVNGHEDPTPEERRAIAKALRLPIRDLFPREAVTA